MIEKKDLNEALDILLQDKPNLTEAIKEGGLLKQLSKALLERALAAELEEHLGYSKHVRSEFS